MDTLQGASGRTYAMLPIDGSNGFPQTFAQTFAGRNYHFRLYVNVSPALLTDSTAVLDLPISNNVTTVSGAGGRASSALNLPGQQAFLVVQVAVDESDGSQQLIFLRKVMPSLEYEAGEIALTFPQQRVAVANLNGQGSYGSQITGGIAPRWA